MRYRVTKEFDFEAAHHLTKVPDGHKCRRPHGHHYRIEVTVESPFLDSMGMVIDYAELAWVFDQIVSQLDHQDLNQVLDFETTAENLAIWVWDFCCMALSLPSPAGMQVVSVKVHETPTTIAEVLL
jgi:6-pyruvoyltetrahydropterin/6-carboxytetrahydropterin synthase